MYRVANQHASGSEARICIRFSTDEGATWTAENVFTDGNPVTGAPFYKVGGTNASLPTLIKAPNGNLLLFASVGPASQWTSADGGATWTDNGAIDPAYDEIDDLVVVGSEIYAVCYQGGYNCDLIKSTDNGVTWAKVSSVTVDADGFNVNEYSICSPAANTLLVIMRYYNGGYVLKRTSTDNGANWGDIEIISNIGTLHRPRARIYNGRIYLLSRNYYTNAIEKTSLSYSDDNGVTWTWGCEMETAYQADCGYADMLQKTDGTLYALSYRGTVYEADIYEYLVSEI